MIIVRSATPRQRAIELKIRGKFPRETKPKSPNNKKPARKDMVRLDQTKIKEFMYARGLKPRSFADKLEVDVNQIQRILHGQRFDPALLDPLLEILGTDHDTLRHIEDE